MPVRPSRRPHGRHDVRWREEHAGARAGARKQTASAVCPRFSSKAQAAACRTDCLLDRSARPPGWRPHGPRRARQRRPRPSGLCPATSWWATRADIIPGALPNTHRGASLRIGPQHRCWRVRPTEQAWLSLGRSPWTPRTRCSVPGATFIPPPCTGQEASSSATRDPGPRRCTPCCGISRQGGAIAQVSRVQRVNLQLASFCCGGTSPGTTCRARSEFGCNTTPNCAICTARALRYCAS